ncbi:hypothetical protein [Kitasatospora sp. NPDC088134]|uniref:hypothetical protein n=1 Tax=Kitasatospora sp. NPDC088134 TaxID=3364071 RepID=UPI0038147BBF
MVQEAWLRYERQQPGTIDKLPAWLTAMAGRISLDLLRSRRAPETVGAQSADGTDGPDGFAELVVAPPPPPCRTSRWRWPIP